MGKLADALFGLSALGCVIAVVGILGWGLHSGYEFRKEATNYKNTKYVLDSTFTDSVVEADVALTDDFEEVLYSVVNDFADNRVLESHGLVLEVYSLGKKDSYGNTDTLEFTYYVPSGEIEKYNLDNLEPKELLNSFEKYKKETR